MVYFGWFSFDPRSDREAKRFAGQLSNGPLFLSISGHGCPISKMWPRLHMLELESGRHVTRLRCTYVAKSNTTS